MPNGNDPTSKLPEHADRSFVSDWVRDNITALVGQYLPGFIAARLTSLPVIWRRQAQQALDWTIVLLQDTRELIED